jgi:phenylpropionate dioxygenase-like ring-hydroxylating dioxygenase large terminal subunit
MADADPAGSAPFRVTNPERIPVKRYYDETFYKAECEKLWPHVWQMACRLEQIENVGDWVEYSNLGQSVIIVRTKDGVKAFHNACRHRGVPLADTGTHGNCNMTGFICPFHGWRWNSDGRNTFVYGRHMFSEAQLDAAELALRPCRLETAIGCAFINFDDDALTLAESIGPLLDNLEAHGSSKLRAEWWYATEIPANWKVAMEAFMEGYHVMRTHPQLQRTAPQLYNAMYSDPNSASGVTPEFMQTGIPSNPNMTVKENILSQMKHLELLSNGMAGMVHKKEIEIARGLVDVDLPEDQHQAVMMWFGIVQDQIHKQLTARGEPLPDLNAVAQSHPVNAVEFVFPHYFLLPFFSNMSAYRIRPTGPESCLFELWSLTFYPEGKEPPPVLEPRVLPYNSQEFPEIPRQDYSNIPLQQKGMHAKGFEFMRLSKQVEGMISNYNRIIDGHLAGADPAKLAAATNTLAGNFDGKIFEYDF